ncbi:unnamed protein product [Urochloa humidicola]
MVEEEARLRFAIIAQVGNATTGFTTAEISSAVADAAGLDVASFVVVPTFPESFLVICSSQDARDRVLAASPAPLAATHLSLRPWTRLVRASSTVLYFKVGLELDGIPEHAWDLGTASKLLARHAWVERLEQATASKEDMSTFKLTAWTKDPHAIPASKLLSIVEPELPVVYSDEDMQRIFGNLEPYLRQKIVMDYPINIHLRSIADFRPRTPSSSEPSPSEDGDSGPDGNPDRSYGFCRGTGPRLSRFPRWRTDGNHGGTTSMSGGHGGGAGQANQMGNSGPTTSAAQACGTLPSGEKLLQKHFPKEVTDRGNTTTEANVPVNAASDGDRTTVDCAATQATEAVEVRVTSQLSPSVSTQDWATVCAPPQCRAPGSPTRQDPMLVEYNCPTPLSRTVLDHFPEIEGSGVGEQTPVMLHEEDPMLLDDAPLRPSQDKLPLPAVSDDSGSSPEALTATVDHQAGLGQIIGPEAPLVNGTKAVDERVAVEEEEDSSPPGFSRAAARKEAKLSAFMDRGQMKIRSPLAPRPAKTKRSMPSTPQTTSALPKRSERLASHPLANVASSKRAEVVLMRRFGVVPENVPINTGGKQAYAKLYKEGMDGDHFEAVRDLLPALWNASTILGTQA